MFKKVIASFLALIVLLPLTVLAQTDASSTNDQGPAFGAGVADCSAYYSFGSVHANISAQVQSVVSGTAITFSGTLDNTNPYPIVDGDFYVKIFRHRSADDSNGPDVVDQFLVKGDLVIPAHGSIPIKFDWKVPAYAISGDYTLATFFTTSRKFNLLGLSFTDDVVGNMVPFTVSGEQTSAVGFDKAGVTIGGSPYHFASFPPRESATDPVTLTATVVNTSGADATANIEWTVYEWDAQLRENAVQEQKPSPITVPAHGKKTVTITVTDATYPVYLAVGTVSWQDTKSIIDARFVRDGVDRLRINFPGVSTFPLQAGVENTLFSCLHNAGQNYDVKGGKLELTLSDMQGNVIHTFTYTGDVTSQMMGVADKFTPTKDYDKFVLDARLYQNGKYIDQAHLVYDCATIDPSMCPKAAGPGLLDNSLTMMVSVIAILVILFAGLVAWMWARRIPPAPPLEVPKA